MADRGTAGSDPSFHESGARVGALLQPVTAGILVAIVGFASTFALVLQAYRAMGATSAEAASGLLAILLAIGSLAFGLSLWTRLPISIAWSMPGAALLIATGPKAGGYPVATGAYLVAAGLVVAAGLWRPFGRAVSAIPISLASAMLAGLLLDLCLAPVRAVAAAPALALPIVLAWAVTWRVARTYAVPAAVAVSAVVIAIATPLPDGVLSDAVPRFVLVPPAFTLEAAIGVAVPLFIVTMASQNVPGLAILGANGYRAPVGTIFVATGLASGLSALAGGHSVNLAAITAALCVGPEAGRDPARRWVAAATSGIVYVLLGLGAGVAAAFVSASPPLLIQAVAGLALLGSFGGALETALARDDHRIPAIITFVTSASGIAFAGIGAAFWGLVAGGAMLLLTKRRDPGRSPAVPSGTASPRRRYDMGEESG